MPIIKTDGGYKIVPTTTKSTTTKKKSTSLASIVKEQKQKQQFLDLAKSAGLDDVVKKYEEPEKLSVLQRVGRGLTSFEVGDAVYAKLYEDQPLLKSYAKNILKGLGSMVTGKEYETETKKTFKDIMVKEGFRDRPGKLDAVDIAGLAGDILTDPTTYLGSFVGKGIGAAMKKGASLATKLPGAKVAAESLGELFKPFYKIEQLGESGEKYINNYIKYAKSTRSEMDDFLDVISKRAKEVEKVTPGAGKKIGVAIETGVKTGDTLLDDVMDELISGQTARKIQEKEKGLLQTELPNYMKHLLTKEAKEYMDKGGDVISLVKPIRAKLASAKGRKLTGTATEINNRLKQKLGFNLFEEDAFKAFATRGVESIKALKTYDFLNQTAGTFGKIAEKDFFEEGIRYVGSTAPQLKGYKFPEQIAKHIDEVQKTLTNDEATNKFLRLYDNINNLWKGSVTGYFPSFHTRNAIGGAFNNWIAGVNNPKVYKEAFDILNNKTGNIITNTGEKISYSDILKLTKEYGVTGQTGYLDVAKFLEKKVNPKFADKLKTAPQKVMGFIENNLRVPLFVDGLKKGMTAEEAAKRVIKFHFDYMPEGFTAFEKNIMKRIIPFYTFTRHNIPLQLEQLIMQPGKYAGLFKLQKSVGLQPGTEEESVLPTWIKEQFSFKSDGGYWAGVGLPIEEATQKLSQPLRGVGTSLTPLIKTPLEQLTNYNIFKEKKISEDVYAKEYRNSPEFLKKWLEMKESKGKDGTIYYNVNPHKKYWLEVIGARGLNTALKLSNSKEDAKNLASLLTTIKKYEYSEEDLRNWAEKDKVRELEDALYNAGLIRKYESFYVPKN